MVPYRISRIACRIFGHQWNAAQGFAVCVRPACHGYVDAVRYE